MALAELRVMDIGFWPYSFNSSPGAEALLKILGRHLLPYLNITK